MALKRFGCCGGAPAFGRFGDVPAVSYADHTTPPDSPSVPVMTLVGVGVLVWFITSFLSKHVKH